jgi:hypothetical protein
MLAANDPIEFFSLPTADGEIPASRPTSRRDLPVARNVLAFSNLVVEIGGRPNCPATSGVEPLTT